jgi:multisubunit Na+/H+ antiporter MnhB subunit
MNDNSKFRKFLKGLAWIYLIAIGAFCIWSLGIVLTIYDTDTPVRLYHWLLIPFAVIGFAEVITAGLFAIFGVIVILSYPLRILDD